MYKIFPLLFFCLLNIALQAQQTTPVYEKYGKVDTADLEMKDCDFEPGAKAEILFDKGDIEYDHITIHRRIKIFNQQGVDYANVRVPYYSSEINGAELKGETFNLEDGKIVITPLGIKSAYIEKINRFVSFLVFALPNVKPGSIIEYQFTNTSNFNWNFQSDLPTRYSEVHGSLPIILNFRFIPHVNQPFVKDIGGPYDGGQDKVLTNIHSLPNEPFMDSRSEALDHMQFTGVITILNTWQKIEYFLMKYTDLGEQLNKTISGEDTIIKHAKSLGSADMKIAYIFNIVKNNMKWNNITSILTIDGTSRAWDKKIGNSAEINLILYHLLKRSGIDAYPMFVGDKNGEKINPFYPNPNLLISTVVYIPIDTTDTNNPKYYVLDATNKYGLFNKPPKNELNRFSAVVDERNSNLRPTFIEDRIPSQQSIYINAEIEPNAKMEGTAEISSTGYNRIENIARYKTAGEQKFTDTLRNNDNDLKITSLKLQNMDADSLPLVQDVNFSLNLSASDSAYIYFNPNLFVTPHNNPFLSENRYSDIDFGYKNNVKITGIFEVPDGYKIYSVPKNTILITPDTSIIFRRIVNQQDNQITVRYSITYKKTMYFKKDYPPFYQFFKKMYEMLNEQIVLKKS